MDTRSETEDGQSCCCPTCDPELFRHATAMDPADLTFVVQTLAGASAAVRELALRTMAEIRDARGTVQ